MLGVILPSKLDRCRNHSTVKYVDILLRIVCRQNYGIVGQKTFTCNEVGGNVINDDMQCGRPVWSVTPIPTCRGMYAVT